jgi:hypothetical protein
LDWVGDISSLRSYPIGELPTTEEDLREWLKKKWDEKEQILRQFAQEKSFAFLRLPAINSSVLFPQFVSLCFWTLSAAVVIYGLVNFSLVRWYVLGTIILSFVLSWLGGVDSIELSFWERTQLKKTF